MIRVAMLPADNQGCGTYRLLQPFFLLQKSGEVHCTFRFNPNTGQFGLSTEDIATADVVVLQKSGCKSQGKDQDTSTLEMVKAFGKKIIYECDDDLATITAENPVRLEEVRYHSGMMGRVKQLMSACRLVTCTTPYLAGVLGRINPEVRTIPNGIDLELWRDPSRATSESGGDAAEEPAQAAPDRLETPQLRIGYLASRNHVEDVRLLIKPWRYIARHYPNVTFVLAGAFYGDLKTALGDRLEFHEGVGMEEYPAFARSMRLDIGVCPLVDSKFARSKSPLKFLEYTALGIPTIASHVEPYVKAGSMALCRSPHDWIEGTKRLFSPDERAKAVVAAMDTVKRVYTAQHSADAWLSVIREVLS